MSALQQAWPMPSAPRPIVIIGTGGIVSDAHLPAYRKTGFAVAGLYDRARAEALAAEWGIARVFGSIEEAAAEDAVFDVAAPPVAHRAILAALPEGAAVLAGEPLTQPGHRIQGGGYSMPTLPLLDEALIDGVLQVSDADAIEGARRLAREEGIFAGFSSGACVIAAERLLAGAHAGSTIAVVLADSGMKYLSTDLWTDDDGTG